MPDSNKTNANSADVARPIVDDVPAEIPVRAGDKAVKAGGRGSKIPGR